MSEKSENLEIEKSSLSSDLSSGLTYQSITDSERQLANSAFKQFENSNFSDCIKTLKTLQSGRPQDTKVTHNICVAEYYQSKCRKVADLYSNLISICKQANIDVDDIESIDDVDQCVIFYNRAVILYHLLKHRGALKILDTLFQFIEPLDEVLGKKICLLLLELYLSTHQPKKALSVVGYIEAVILRNTNKSNKSSEKNEVNDDSILDEMKLKVVQMKARCYTMSKTAKLCKREVKTLITSGSKMRQIAAFILKSQLEYQRGNYKKAIKILNSPEWPSDYSEYFVDTGDCLQALYYNNMGCIHYYMGKPSLGTFYIEKGLKELESETSKLKEKASSNLYQPLHTLSLNVRNTLYYNLAMQYFQQQKYETAFKLLVKVSECFFDNPRLWLRIAECCIQIHKQNSLNNKNYETVKAVIGSGKHNKVIIRPTYQPVKPCAIDSSNANSPTLPYAILCLKNALFLLPKEVVTSNESLTDTSSVLQQSEEKDLNPLEEKSVQVSPCHSIPMTEVANLRNSILIALSYTSLRVGDLILAHDYSLQLLAQPSISGAHRYLAHMYAGEALVYLDKISQAVEHFNPELFIDISQSLPPLVSDDASAKPQSKADTPDRSDDSNPSLKLYPAWSLDSIKSAQLLAQYNLSVVYTLRGEWSKALRLVTEIIGDGRAPPQSKALVVYIHLCKGATDAALSYLDSNVNTSCPS